MLFRPFDFPKSQPKIFEIDIQNWDIVNVWDVTNAPKLKNNENGGHWCTLGKNDFYMYRDQSELIIRYNETTYCLEKGDKEYFLENQNVFFFWNKFILRKLNKEIINVTYKDPYFSIFSLLSAFVFDDDYYLTPFELIVEQLNPINN